MRQRLRNVEKKEAVYTDKNIGRSRKGLGKNFMTEASRLKAVKTYQFFYTLYALRTLLEALEGGVRLEEKLEAHVI